MRHDDFVWIIIVIMLVAGITTGFFKFEQHKKISSDAPDTVGKAYSGNINQQKLILMIGDKHDAPSTIHDSYLIYQVIDSQTVQVGNRYFPKQLDKKTVAIAKVGTDEIAAYEICDCEFASNGQCSDSCEISVKNNGIINCFNNCITPECTETHCVQWTRE